MTTDVQRRVVRQKSQSSSTAVLIPKVVLYLLSGIGYSIVTTPKSLAWYPRRNTSLY